MIKGSEQGKTGSRRIHRSYHIYKIKTEYHNYDCEILSDTIIEIDKTMKSQ